MWVRGGVCSWACGYVRILDERSETFQQAEKATREWALDVVNYWKDRLET